jgi:hypothetical protein
MNALVGTANVLFATFDCLRYDVARDALAQGLTPTFTLPAHQAFFHGFLPTPLGADRHERLFALEFEGSLTVGPRTCVFHDVASVPAGFAAYGYRTFCVGGVGFFNKRTPLGRVLPGFFQRSAWSPALGVTAKDSTANQVGVALDWLASVPAGERVFLFLNVSATHPPHALYLDGAAGDSLASQAAALAYADAQLPPLFAALRRRRGACFCLAMADHGEAHGEDGRRGHRIAHPTVTTVPYAHWLLS